MCSLSPGTVFCLRFGGWGCRLTLSLVVPLLYKRVTPCS